MEGYLGEEVVTGNESPYADYTPEDWAMTYIESYGQIDGGHHKQWVLDQVARILNDTPVIVKKASWDNGHYEYRFETSEPSKKYLKWIEDMRGEYGEEWADYEYTYDEGIAP